MSPNPAGWGRRVFSTLALILVIAFVARWAYELLAPLVPFVLSLLVVGFVGLAIFKRRR